MTRNADSPTTQPSAESSPSAASSAEPQAPAETSSEDTAGAGGEPPAPSEDTAASPAPAVSTPQAETNADAADNQDAPTSPQADRHPQPQPNPPCPPSGRGSAAGTVGSFVGRPVPAVVPRGGVGYLHRLTYLLAVAAAFGLAPLTSKLGTAAGAVALVLLGVGLALAASASANATAVIGGSLGALASGMLTAISPALAGGVLVALCFAERTGRVENGWARLVHVALAVAGGALAGLVTATYTSAEPGVRVVAVVVAAVLAALPLFVEADDPRAHALDGLAEQVPEPARQLLHRGAALCRTADESILDRPLREQVRKSWQKLLQLGQARARLASSESPAAALLLSAGVSPETGTQTSAVARRLDEQIAEHVAVLTRAFTAVDAAQAAELSLEDTALRNVKTTGESLEQVAEAIVEDV